MIFSGNLSSKNCLNKTCFNARLIFFILAIAVLFCSCESENVLLPDEDDNVIIGPPPLRKVHVKNVPELKNALVQAKPGDHIILANGNYEETFTLSKDGSENNPIVIRSTIAHGANINGFFNLDGAHGWLYQLRFQPGRMQMTGPDTKVLRCKFLHSTGGLGVIIIRGNAQRAEIAYNSLYNYGDDGTDDQRGISLRIASDGVSRDVHIHHNYLLKQRGEGGVIGIGISKSNTDVDVRALVEWNLIEDANHSAVYLKSSGNTVRFNTVRQITYTKPSGFSSRHGYNNDFIANVSINAAGVWLRGKNSRAIGNYKDNAKTSVNDLHGATRGTILQDDFKSSSNTQWPAAESCSFIGNIGGLAIGSGYSGHEVKALNNIIEAHSGDIIFVENNHEGTMDNRNNPASISVPEYVILNPSDVGPNAP